VVRKVVTDLRNGAKVEKFNLDGTPMAANAAPAAPTAPTAPAPAAPAPAGAAPAPASK
jgi:hypothetical protein